MKFWKILSNMILQTLPDWRDKFLSYKLLKKHLKLLPPPSDAPSPDFVRPIKRPRFSDEDTHLQDDDVSKEVNDFVALLESEIEKFNSFFVEKEEEYIIRWKELQDRLVDTRQSSEEVMKIGREVVDFHGEMVLLENYSALNYTGLVKILKKYDKRSGTLIRLPFIQKVLQEPFYMNDTLRKLVKECEVTLENLFSQNKPPISPHVTVTGEGFETSPSGMKKEQLVAADKELAEIESMENMYMKLTMSALRALKEIRGGSSTVNALSLPPMESSAQEEGNWKNIPIVEQANK